MIFTFFLWFFSPVFGLEFLFCVVVWGEFLFRFVFVVGFILFDIVDELVCFSMRNIQILIREYLLFVSAAL